MSEKPIQLKQQVIFLALLIWLIKSTYYSEKTGQKSQLPID